MDSLTAPIEQVALVTSQKDGMIAVLDFKTNTHLLSMKQNQCNKNCVSLIPQTHLPSINWGLMSCAFDKPLGMTYGWEKELPLIKFTLPEKMTCLEVSPSGRYCAGGADSGKIYIWEIITGRLLNAVEAHYKAVHVIRFSHDEQLLVSGSLDSIIHIWNLNKFQPSSLSSEITPKLTLSDHTLAITDIRIGMGSSKQCYVYSSSLDHTVKIWKLNQGKLTGTLIFPSPVNCLSVDGLERKLSVGCQNNSIYSIELYKPCQGQSLLGFDSIFNEADLISVASMDPTLFSVLLGHESSVVDINYNWSSSQLISADQSGYLMVWDVDSKQRTNSYSIFKGGITNLKVFTLPPNLTNLNQLKAVHHPVVSLQRMIISDPNDKANTHLTILPKKVNFELFPPSKRTHINHFPNEYDDDEIESKDDEVVRNLNEQVTHKQDNILKLDKLLKSLEKANSDQYKSELSKFINS